MRIRNIVLAAVVLVPIVTLAQAPPSQATPMATLERMRANVAKITEPAEKERWQANVTMWQVWIGDTAAWESGDVDRMRAAFKTMKANVAKIAEAGERERWQANCDLWQAALASGQPSKADVDKREAVLGQMKENVSRITATTERSRWLSNLELWVSFFGPN